jgi:hypothetical protein
VSGSETREDSQDHCGAASWDDGALVNTRLREVELSQGTHLAEAVREGGGETCGIQKQFLQCRQLDESGGNGTSDACRPDGE